MKLWWEKVPSFLDPLIGSCIGLVLAVALIVVIDWLVL